MTSYLQPKYNSDLLRFIGFACCSPASTALFNFVIFGFGELVFSVMLLLRFIIALLLCILGVWFIQRAREILEEVDIYENRRNN